MVEMDARRSEGATDDDSSAREAHSAALLLAVVVLLWGGISLFVVPFHPFGVPNVAQVVVCVPAMLYFVATRARPRRRVADLFSLVVVVYSLAILPWTTVEWCRLGRPWEAFTVPQAATLCMAFVVPRRLGLGFTLIALFAGESLFVHLYVRHLGRPELMSATEPYASLGFAFLAVGLFTLRRRRMELVRKHVQLESDVETMRRVSPLLADVRRDLSSELSALQGDLGKLGDGDRKDQTTDTVVRAVDRLSELARMLDDLVAEPYTTSSVGAERRLLDADAHFGAMVLSALGTMMAATAGLMAHVGKSNIGWMFAAAGIINAYMLAYLVVTRNRPSRRRSTIIMVVFVLMVVPLASYNQWLLLDAHRPYSPLLGHKFLMIGLGMTAASRIGVSLALIVFTAVEAVALYFGFHLGDHKDVIAMSEPAVTLVYLLLALATLQLREHRRMASLRLLRAEVEAEALQRRASIFLSLRDRLNSPLQVLVIGANRVEAIRGAVARLAELSRKLAELDIPIPPRVWAASLDAERALRGGSAAAHQ